MLLLWSLGQDVFVYESVGKLCSLGCEAGEAGGKPRLRGDGDFGAASGYSVVDFVGGVTD